MMKAKKWMRAGVALTLCAALLCGGALAYTGSFSDEDEYLGEEDVDWDVEGWADQDWQEDDVETSNREVSRFPDVSSTADYAEAVEALADWGVITGKSTGLFDPDGYITRGEMATVMCRSLNLAPAPDCSRFADTAGHWAAGYVETAAAYGIINGDGTGNFRPNDQVTYEQVVKMVVCGCQGGEDYALSLGGWPSGYLQAGSILGLMDDLPANTTAPAQRSTVAQLVYNAVK